MAQKNCSGDQDNSRRGVAEFLSGRKLNLVKVAGLQRLDENFCDKLETFADGGYATLGTSSGSVLGTFDRTRNGRLSNHESQLSQATTSNGGNSASRYIEDGSVPGCSGIQNELARVESADDLDGSKKSDLSLDQELECDDFEDSADEELEFEVSDDGSSVAETADDDRVPPIHCLEGESGEISVSSERISSEKADSEPGDKDNEDSDSSDSESALGSGIIRDVILAEEPRDEVLSVEEASVPRHENVGSTVGAVDLRTEIAKLRNELFSRKESRAENDEILEHETIRGANPEENRAQAPNDAETFGDNAQIRTRNIETEVDSAEGRRSADIHTQEDLENTFILGNGFFDEEPRRLSQNAQSSINDEGEDDDDAESDDCQTTDGFQTADDAASETDSVAIFFDCEDEVSTGNNADSEPNRGRVPCAVVDPRKAGEKHNYFYAGSIVTGDSAIEGDMSEGGDSSSSSGGFDDTVMEQTAFEVPPGTPPLNEVGAFGTERDKLGDAEGEQARPPPLFSLKEVVVLAEFEDVDLQSDASTEDASPPTSPGADSEPDGAVDNDRLTAAADGVPDEVIAPANAAAITSDGLIPTEPPQIRVKCSSNGDRVSEDAGEASMSDVVAEKPIGKDSVEEQRANDRQVQGEAEKTVASAPLQERTPQDETSEKKPANDQPGVEGHSKKKANEEIIPDLEKLARHLTKNCSSSVAEIMGTLKAEKDRSTSLVQKRKLVVKALKNCSQKNARIFVGMLKEHLLRVRYLVRTEGDSALPVSAEVINFVSDMSLVDYLKLEEFIDRTASQLASPIAKVISPAEVAERVQYDFNAHLLRGMFHAHLRKATLSLRETNL